MFRKLRSATAAVKDQGQYYPIGATMAMSVFIGFPLSSARAPSLLSMDFKSSEHI